MSYLVFCVRQLVISNMSWFHATRQTVGEAAGRERAININRPVLEKWYPEGIPIDNKLPITSHYFKGDRIGEGVTDKILIDKRSINLQGGGKNWRLAGDAVQGDFYGTLREDDLLLMMFDAHSKDLSWFCIRSGNGPDQFGGERGLSVVNQNERNLFQRIMNILGSPNAAKSMWLPDFRAALTILTDTYQLKPAIWELLRMDEYLAQNTHGATLTHSVTRGTRISRPHNRILYGAPGTGKSYQINQQASRAVFGSNITRVTFHADYSNAQFIGSYKPKAYYVAINTEIFESFKPNPSDIVISDRRPVLDYKIVAGPFLATLARALKKPEENHLLIIEEINRANAAAVFGDAFQLLDRDNNGVSEYASEMPAEISQWLLECDVRVDGYLISETDDPENGRRLSVRIPSNMYIWATMNSADQGVMPLDSAFKRRWSFEYIPLNEGESAVTHKVNLLGRLVPWNDLRRAINEYLETGAGDRLRIAEDKLIGPFFIKESELKGENSQQIVLDKLLLYLHQDLARHNPTLIFSQRLYSTIYSTYKEITEAYSGADEDESFLTALKKVFTAELAGMLNSKLFKLIIKDLAPADVSLASIDAITGGVPLS